MLIDERFRKCVAFLVTDKPGKYMNEAMKKPAGTAFFVRVPINTDCYITYAVTARHAIDKSRADGSLYVRINPVSGKADDIPISQDDWVSLPLTDVAVMPVSFGTQDYDLLSIPLSMLATEGIVKKQEIGIGDDVFFVGLFSEYAGQERNQPIIRFGNISLMPHEEIPLKLDPAPDSEDATPTYAYLVEARSWGGLSGSPAFVYFPFDRKPGISRIAGGEFDKLGKFEFGEGPFALLGLVYGHYPIKQEVVEKGNILGGVEVPINAGIAVVIPAQKIYDTLMCEELVSERNRILEEH